MMQGDQRGDDADRRRRWRGQALVELFALGLELDEFLFAMGGEGVGARGSNRAFSAWSTP